MKKNIDTLKVDQIRIWYNSFYKELNQSIFKIINIENNIIEIKYTYNKKDKDYANMSFYWDKKDILTYSILYKITQTPLWRLLNEK